MKNLSLLTLLAVLCLGVCLILSVEAEDELLKSTPIPAQPSQADSHKGMVHIVGGTFQMGCSPGDSKCLPNEKPNHNVTVDSFWMDATEVTNAQYRKCLSSGSCSAIDENECTYSARAHESRGRSVRSLMAPFKGDSQPVVCVSWTQAVKYCQWVGKRLPTEAEWEYAARGKTTGPHYGDLNAIAWYETNSGRKTHPVAKKQPNAYGLYDMLGNAWEWTADWYDENYYAASPTNNPQGPSSGSKGVMRGGSFRGHPDWVRASSRFYVSYRSKLVLNDQGFRCIRD